MTCDPLSPVRSSPLARLVWVLVAAMLSASAVADERASIDLLVIAPHSDDEAIGCATVMRRALASEQRVGVVIVTQGDGFPKAAAAATQKPIAQLTPADFFTLAALRQRHTLQAMTQLGVPRDNVLFLGYPDGGLKSMVESHASSAYRNPHTLKSETYAVIGRDYHAQVHSRPAPYLKQSLIDDLAEIIRTRRPRELYTTHESDTHGDHRATCSFVRDAIRAAGYRGTVWTYIVHGRAPDTPPGLLVTLTPDEFRQKRSLLEIYQAGVSPVHDDLAEHYTLPHERFWAMPSEAPANK